MASQFFTGFFLFIEPHLFISKSFLQLYIINILKIQMVTYVQLTCNKLSWNTNSWCLKDLLQKHFFLTERKWKHVSHVWLGLICFLLVWLFLVNQLCFCVAVTASLNVCDLSFLGRKEFMFYCVPKELSFRNTVFYDLKELFMPNKHLIRVYVARLSPREHWRSSIKKGEQA